MSDFPEDHLSPRRTAIFSMKWGPSQIPKGQDEVQFIAEGYGWRLCLWRPWNLFFCSSLGQVYLSLDRWDNA